MYFCISAVNNEYSIVDTSDNVVEKVSLDVLKSYLTQGVEILGVTLESLSLHDTTTVLVDIKGHIVLSGKMFNGFYFEDYDSETASEYNNRYLYSIVNSKDIDVLSILTYLQQANNSIFNKALASIPDSECGYVVDVVFNDGMFNVKELGTMTEYGFNYCYVVHALAVNKLRVQGCSDLTMSEVVINGSSFSLKDVLSSELSSNSSSSLCTFDTDKTKDGLEYITEAHFNSSSLYDFMRNSDGKYLTKTLFPIVPLFDYIRSTPDYDDLLETLDTLSTLSGGSYSGHIGSIFNFGTTAIDIAKLSDYLDFIPDDSPAKADTDAYKNVLTAKKKLLFGDSEESDITAFRVDYNYYNGNNQPYKSVLSTITKEKHLDCVRTDFGTILTSTYIRDTDDMCNLKRLGGVDMFRISHTNAYYYNLGRSGITIYLSTKNSGKQAKYIGRDDYTEYLDYFRNDLGYYYDRPCIMPLFVHSICNKGFGLEVNILVAVNTNKFKSFLPRDNKNKEKYNGWGSTFLVVPILLTGVYHYFYKDFVVFKLLFQDLIMTKETYNNLAVDVNEKNDLICIDKCTEVSSTKLCNCDVGNVSTSSSDSIRKSMTSYMRAFNRLIDSLDYIE